VALINNSNLALVQEQPSEKKNDLVASKLASKWQRLGAFMIDAGKMILGIRVVANNFEKLSIGKTLLRESFGRLLSVIVFGHLWIFFNGKNKTSWDYMVG